MNDDVEKLKVAARALRDKLEHYAKTDKDALRLLRGMIPWFEKIARGEVIPPQEDRFSWHLIDPEAPLTKYDDLVEIGSKYTKVLEKWNFKTPWDEWASFEASRAAGIAKNNMQTAARLLRGRLEDYAKADDDLGTALKMMAPWFDTINGIDKLTARVVDGKLEYYVDPDSAAHTVLCAMAPWFDKIDEPRKDAPSREHTFI